MAFPLNPQTLVKTVVVVAFLTGCGNTALTAPIAPAAPRAVAAQADLQIASAQKAIRAQIEKRIPDYHVSLSDLMVAPTPIIGFCTFTATKTVAGLAGAFHYRIEGNYNRRTGKVAVTKQEPLD